MTKTEFVKALADSSGMTQKDADRALHLVLNELSKALAQGEKIVLPGFGTFEVRTRGSRTGVNPQTGKKIEIAESRSPSFKAGSALKALVANMK